MNKQFIIWILILVSLTSFSQDLLIDATYFDKNGNSYKIERKYTDGKSIMYVRHGYCNSVRVKRQMFHNQDTTLIQETTYDIFVKKTKIEKFNEYNLLSFSSNITIVI